MATKSKATETAPTTTPSVPASFTVGETEAAFTKTAGGPGKPAAPNPMYDHAVKANEARGKVFAVENITSDDLFESVKKMLHKAAEKLDCSFRIEFQPENKRVIFMAKDRVKRARKPKDDDATEVAQ